MNRPGTVVWFARHEMRLAWRDFLAMITAGRRRRTASIIIGFLAFASLMHGLAYFVVAKFSGIGVAPDKATLVYATAILILSSSLMVSQALEAVTRAFYARADLDLILSSPVRKSRVFAVRVAAIALTTLGMALLLAGPFINVLAMLGGARWLTAYGLVAAAACTATALAVGIGVALFRTIGARRARFVTQVLAALVGASFVIGLQAAAVLSYGTYSRFAILHSERLTAILPPPESAVWLPARAMMGDAAALVPVLAAALVLVAGAIVLFSTRFSDYAVAAAGAIQPRSRSRWRRSGFRALSAMQALRRKEWTLLIRDPWLMSQTLMQLLYLLPPALLLWRKFGGRR